MSTLSENKGKHDPQHALSKFFSTIFSRFTITLLLIFLEVVLFAYLMLELENYAWYVTLFFAVAAVITNLFVIWKDYNPAYKIAWIVFISAMPALGIVCYLLFGNKRPTRRMRSRLMPQDAAHMSDLAQQDDLSGIEDERLRTTTEYISEKGHFPAWKGNSTRYYPLGDDWYEDMLEDLKKAEHFIFMEYFIIGRGSMWSEILAVLKEKVKQGVDVRIIYDDFGSMKVLPANFVKLMEAEGIKAMSFNTVHPIFSLVYNNRDHRKICVVDGYIGYTGGANIADEYINREERFGHWKDACVRIEGNAVWNLTVMFLNMWDAFKHEEEDYSPFAPGVWHPEPFDEKGKGVVQPFSDSPLDNENVGEYTYLEIVNQAQDYVYIYTPYLIIDNEMEVALGLAAKRGVDVTIVTPHIPDKPLVFSITRSYYNTLISCGVKIKEYTPGFVHSKVCIADDRMAMVGTVNMDFRSFFFHFEDGAFMIDTECIPEIRKDFEETFGICEDKPKGAYYQNFFAKLYGALLRVISPLV